MRNKALRFPLFILNSLLVLPLGCVLALFWANTSPESYYRFAHALQFPVNEVGVVFFFALVTKEIVEATLPGGELHPWRRAALPIAAAVGGVIVPVIIYVACLRHLDEPRLIQAWMVTCGVDVAACYLVGGLIFGRHPAVPFLLLLAVASDAIGLVILAAVTPAAPIALMVGLVLVAVGMATAFVMRRSGVASFWPYVMLSGGLSWCGLYLSGVHPALALVPVMPFMPHRPRPVGLFIDPPARCHDALSCFARWWAAPVQAILFLFGLVNAGVPLHGLEPGMWALPIAVLAGRPVGILLAVEAAVFAGLHRIPRVGWRELLVVGCAASVGLTVALFFATGVMPLGNLLLQLKTGALLTSAGAAVALLVAWSLGVGRFHVAAAVQPRTPH